jgi:hypothetical protein
VPRSHVTAASRRSIDRGWRPLRHLLVQDADRVVHDAAAVRRRWVAAQEIAADVGWDTATSDAVEDFSAVRPDHAAARAD